jgi:hypothetical protein
MIWRFPSAPDTLKALHPASESPEWLVLIPRPLNGPDLDQAILQRSDPGQVTRYELPDGDIVYVGTSKIDGLSQGVVALTRPSAMAATNSKRK